MAMQWSSSPTARLTVREDGTTNTFGFEGVNSANNAGSPQDFLNAANRLLAIGGFSAVITDITRTVKEKGVDE